MVFRFLLFVFVCLGCTSCAKEQTSESSVNSSSTKKHIDYSEILIGKKRSLNPALPEEKQKNQDEWLFAGRMRLEKAHEMNEMQTQEQYHRETYNHTKTKGQTTPKY